VGKTAQEVLAQNVAMADALATVQPPKPVQREPAAPSPVPAAPTLPDNDAYTLNPADATQRALEYNWQVRAQPYLDQLAAQVAGTGRQVASIQYADEFRRWGPEIDALVAGAAPQQRTPALYEQAVKLVKSNHIDEIAAERAQAKLAELGVTDRTSGGGTVASVPSGTVDLTKLPASYKDAMEQMGIGPSELHEFLGKTGQTMEQFVESANRNQIITDMQWDRKGRSHVVMDMEKLYPKGTKVQAW